MSSIRIGAGLAEPKVGERSLRTTVGVAAIGQADGADIALGRTLGGIADAE